MKRHIIHIKYEHLMEQFKKVQHMLLNDPPVPKKEQYFHFITSITIEIHH